MIRSIIAADSGESTIRKQLFVVEGMPVHEWRGNPPELSRSVGVRSGARSGAVGDLHWTELGHWEAW